MMSLFPKLFKDLAINSFLIGAVSTLFIVQLPAYLHDLSSCVTYMVGRGR